jgi:PAS domain S-box-containing protein
LKIDDYRILFEQTPAALIAVDLDGRVVDANARFIDLLGCPISYLSGRHVEDLAGDAVGSQIAAGLARVRHGADASFSINCAGPGQGNGTPRARVKLSLARDASGQPLAFLGMAEAVAGIDCAERPAEQERQHHRAILETLVAHISVLGLDGRIVEFNQAPVSGPCAVGFPIELIPTLPFWELPCWDTAETRARIHEAFLVAREGGASRLSAPIQEREGRRMICDLSLSALRDATGGISNVVVHSLDVTEREAQSARTRELLSIIESAHDLMMSVTPAGRLSFINAMGRTRLGIGMAEDIDELAVAGFLQPETASVLLDMALPAAARDGFWQGEMTYRHRDGSVFQASQVIVCHRRANGDVERFSVVARDITGQKTVERALAASEARWRAVFEFEPDCLKVISAERELLAMNPSGLAMLEAASVDELRLIGLLSVVAPEFRQSYQESVATALAGRPSTLEFRVVGLKGTERWLSTHNVPVKTAGEAAGVAYVLGVTRDVTAERNAAKVLRESEAKLREAQGIAGLGSWEHNMENGTIIWSDEIYNLFEIDRNKIEPSYGSFMEAVHPDDRAMVDGTYRASLAARTPYEITHRLQMRDGRSKYVTGRSVTYFDHDGTPLRSIGTLQDITARREAELALEAAKIAAEAANRAKSLFLSNMSHELRTPLNAVLGFAQLLLFDRRATLAPIQEEHVKDIIAGGQHLLRLINDILDLAKIDVGGADLAIKDVMLDDVMREAVALVRPMTMDRKIALECDARPGTVLRADAVRLKQALLNLLANAIKYNRNSGRIVVTSAEVGDGYLRISVADTGIGIPETRHAEVFRPFSRLSANRQSVEGTGIGLALTKRLIEAMNGRIGFSSKAGEGSTFWIERRWPGASPGLRRLPRPARPALERDAGPFSAADRPAPGRDPRRARYYCGRAPCSPSGCGLASGGPIPQAGKVSRRRRRPGRG